jgi:hypothetical protein
VPPPAPLSPRARRRDATRPVAGATAAAIVAVPVLALAACGGAGAGADPAAACGLVGRLADTAEIVERADVADPDAFAEALDAAVSEYVAILEDLREAAPEELAGDLDRLEAAVTQYDFDEAVRARAALDDYADRTCPPARATAATSRAPSSLPPVAAGQD